MQLLVLVSYWGRES